MFKNTSRNHTFLSLLFLNQPNKRFFNVRKFCNILFILLPGSNTLFLIKESRIHTLLKLEFGHFKRVKKLQILFIFKFVVVVLIQISFKHSGYIVYFLLPSISHSYWIVHVQLQRFLLLSLKLEKFAQESFWVIGRMVQSIATCVIYSIHL